MAEPKSAKRVVTLEDVQVTEQNKVMVAVSCIPLIGLIMFFVEKEDVAVRYTGAQFAVLGLLAFVVWIPCIGQLLGIASMIAIVYGIIMSLQKNRVDLPLLSGVGLSLVNSI